MRPVICLTVLLVFGSALYSAPQSPASSVSAFEVATVRQNIAGGRASRTSLPSGRLVIQNMTLEMIVMFAYGMGGTGEQYRLAGGPTSLLSERFDITAIPTEGTAVTAADHPRMLRALLAERFKLRAHTEKRRIPIYALTVAREGRLGPAIHPSSVDCAAWAKGAIDQLQTAEKPRGANDRPLCTLVRHEGGVTKSDAGPLVTLVRWARANLRDRPIVDMTELTGDFEWEVTFAIPVTSSAESDFPSIFTAFSEQLGLKLEPTNGPVDVLVIDSVEMPSPN